MNRSKKKPEKAVITDITERVLKFWFIDTQNKKIKKVDDYDGTDKLVSFDSELERVITESGVAIKVYTTFREANITLYVRLVEEKRDQWKLHVDESIKLNDEISALLDKLDKLRAEWE